MRNVLGLALLGLLIAGCTREDKSGSLKVTVPLQKNVGSLTGYNLEIAIANIQISGRPPVVARIETRDGQITIPYGNQLTFPTISNLPSNTTALVQVLSIYEGATQGDLRFYYGDSTATLNGTTEVTINATPAGVSSGLEAKIAGRFLTSNTGGPTGRLVTLYEVGNGKPPMTVEEGWIVNGWFEAFAVQGAKFDLLAVPENVKLFDDLTVDGSGGVGHLVGGSMTALGTSASRLQMQAPPSFRKRGTGVEPQPQMRLWLGFFDNASDAYVNSVTRSVRYPNPGDQGVMNLYLDANTTIPLRYRATGGTTNDVRLSSGGTSATMDALYSLTDTGCTPTEYQSGQCLLFYHARIGSGREGFSGMQIPFRTMDPFSLYSGYTSTRFLPTGCAGSACIKIKWDLLPQAGVPLADIEVWYKYTTSNDGGDGGGDKWTCDALPSMGFAKHGAVTTPTVTESYDFIASGMNQSNYYNHRFFLCPRINTALGPKYIGRPMRVESHGGGGLEHLGWAIAGSGTVSAAVIHQDYNQIDDLPAAPSPFYIQASVLGMVAGGIAVGDEVMIHISAKGGASTCGNYNGQALQVGSYAFARVVGIPTSSELRLSRGTFLDDMYDSGINGTQLAASPTSPSFCFVQVSKVRHYNNLTINPSSYLAVNPLNLVGTGGGGILPVRVNGTLTMSGNSGIKATGAGFIGGNFGFHGAGESSDTNSTSPSSNAGQMGISGSGNGGGGGGYGRGGRNIGGGDGAAGSGSMGGMGNVRMMMGGGGGGPLTATSGSSGGGLVFVMAEKLSVVGSANIVASNATNVSSGNGGAGGGGSVFLFARKVSGGGALSIEALGGNSFSNAQGGKGGGGSAINLICANDTVSPAVVTSNAAKGSIGADTSVGAPAQDGWILNMNPSEHSYLCESN